jgi:hypothetical protein
MSDDGYDGSTETRFVLYKVGCRERGIEAPSWSEWLSMRQPAWGHDEDNPEPEEG